MKRENSKWVHHSSHGFHLVQLAHIGLRNTWEFFKNATNQISEKKMKWDDVINPSTSTDIPVLEEIQFWMLRKSIQSKQSNIYQETYKLRLLNVNLLLVE